jgi:hypothetical protein
LQQNSHPKLWFKNCTEISQQPTILQQQLMFFFLPNWPVPGFRSSTILQPWDIWTLNFEEWGTFVFFFWTFFFYL